MQLATKNSTKVSKEHVVNLGAGGGDTSDKELQMNGENWVNNK